MSNGVSCIVIRIVVTLIFSFTPAGLFCEGLFPGHSVSASVPNANWMVTLEDFESGDPWDVNYKDIPGVEITAITTVSSLERTAGKGKNYLYVQLDGLNQGGVRLIPRKKMRPQGFVRFINFQIRCYGTGETIYIDLSDANLNHYRRYITRCDTNRWMSVNYTPEASIIQRHSGDGEDGITLEGFYVEPKSDSIRMLIDDITAEVRPFSMEYDPFG